ncbi:MAG TPA: hypothetical protein VK687_03690 [Bryobacteraceae bacterium]|nr:hypothetical protein [Bryobacteraceae bacterium]
MAESASYCQYSLRAIPPSCLAAPPLHLRLCPFTIGPMDHLIVMGESELLQKLEQFLTGTVA